MKKILLVAVLFLCLFFIKTTPVAAVQTCLTNLQCVLDHDMAGCRISDDGKKYICDAQIVGRIVAGKCITNLECNVDNKKPGCQLSADGTKYECDYAITTVIVENATGKDLDTTPEEMKGCSNRSINTAIGCIPVGNTNDFISFILRWAIGIGGGIAFLLILYSGFMVMTSQGNPERLKAGQELLTSALAGLIMLIFSVFILRIIGVDILGIIPK